MGEETSDTMNLDLNLGPGPEPASGLTPNDPVNLDEWSEEQEPIYRFREAFRLRAPHRWRWRQVEIPPETRNISMELNHMMAVANAVNGSSLQAGEGSVAAEVGTNEAQKTCEINDGTLKDETSENKGDFEKGSGDDGGFFDCNICLDLARDPVVTCCGHLFCWPCLYRWLHLHSDAKECPVCKGEVTMKNVTPIYGRGINTRESEEDASLKIPLRPHARRVESFRQTIHRTAFTYPLEDMIRRLGSRFDLTRDLVQPAERESSREAFGRANTLLNRILTSRGMRREQPQAITPDDAVDLTQGDISGPEGGGHGHPLLQSLLLRRAQSQRAIVPSLSSAFTPADRLTDAFLRIHPTDRNQENPLPVDDRDSFSSIAAVINSESQLDTNVEIDSMVSLSTSSSRVRNEASRASDVDSGDSRAPRRRRLN